MSFCYVHSTSLSSDQIGLRQAKQKRNGFTVCCEHAACIMIPRRVLNLRCAAQDGDIHTKRIMQSPPVTVQAS